MSREAPFSGLFKAAEHWWDRASTKKRGLAVLSVLTLVCLVLILNPDTSAVPRSGSPSGGFRVQVADLPPPLAEEVHVGSAAFTVPNHAACALLEDYQAQQALAAQGDRNAWASFMVDHAPNCTWVKNRIRVRVTDVSGLYAWVKFRPEGSYQEFYADSEAVEAELSEVPSSASADQVDAESEAREAIRRIAAWESEQYQDQGRFAGNNPHLDSLINMEILSYHVGVQNGIMGYVAETRHSGMPGRHCIIFGTPPNSNGIRQEMSGGGRFNQIDCREIPREWTAWPDSR